MGYVGTEASVQLAEYGLFGAKNLARTPPTSLLTAKNISLHQGVVTRCGGSTKYNAAAITAAPQILGGIEWWPTDADQRVIVYTNAGDILRDTGAGTFATTMKAGLSATGIPVWALGGKETVGANRKAFMTNGVNIVQVISADAVVTADLTTPPADWAGAVQPRSLFQHNGRLWGILQSWIYGSKTTNHEDFIGGTAASMPVYPGEYSFLQGGISFNGRLYLFAWPRGIYWLDDSSTTVAEWLCKRLNPAIGLAGSDALCVVDNDVLFMSEIGHLHLLSGIQEFGDVRASDITAANELTEWIDENMDVSDSALSRVQARYYAAKKQAHFTCRSSSGSYNDLRLIVDFNRPGVPRISYETKDICQSLWLYRDSDKVQRPMSGDEQGFVWKLDQQAISVDGNAFASEFQTPHIDFRHLDEKLGSRSKNFDWLEAVGQITGNYDVTVDVWIDGDYRKSLTFNFGSVGAALGTFKIGTHALAGDILKNIRKRLALSGYRISLVCRLSGVGQQFSLSAFKFGFVPGGP